MPQLYILELFYYLCKFYAHSQEAKWQINNASVHTTPNGVLNDTVEAANPHQCTAVVKFCIPYNCTTICICVQSLASSCDVTDMCTNIFTNFPVHGFHD